MEMIYISESRINIKLIYLLLIELLLSLFNFFSLGLFYPFFLYIRYFFVYSKTQISNKKLKFKGNIFVFYYHYLFWYFLTIITFGIYHFFLEFKLYKWAISSTYIEGEENESYFNKDILESFLLNILSTFIIIITLGIGYPFAKCIRYRWRLRNTIISGKRLRFIGNSSDLSKKYLKWLLLSIATFGFFALFIDVLDEKYRVENTVFADSNIINEKEEKESNALDYAYLNTNEIFFKIIIVLGFFAIVLLLAYLIMKMYFILIFIDMLLLIELLFLFDVTLMFISKLFENNKKMILAFVLCFIIISLFILAISLFMLFNNILYLISILLLNISIVVLFSIFIFYLFIYKKQTYL